MIPFVVIGVLFIVVLIEALIMARQEVIRLRSIVDQWAEEQENSEEADEEYAQHWAKVR